MYNTIQDYIDWVGSTEAADVTDPARVTPDTIRIENALKRANAEIVSRLSGRFDRDVLTYADSDDLKHIELTIARWNLDQTFQPRDFVYESYKQVVNRLQRIADGKDDLLFELGTDAPEIDNPTNSGGRVLFGNTAIADNSALFWL